RGWSVEVIERRQAPALEASGNRVGAVRPAVNLADSANARLARAAFLLASRLLAREGTPAEVYAQSGLLHVATSRARAQRMAAIVEAHAFPPQYLQPVDGAEASRRAGYRIAGPAWWFDAGGWARPQALCGVLLGGERHRIRVHFGTAARGFARTAQGWRVLDAGGRVLAEAPVVVAANGQAAHGLGLPQLPRLIAVRG